MTEERRIPNWLVNEEQHMRIKNERALTQYQVGVFHRELTRTRRNYERLKAGEAHRAEVFGAKYRTRKELDDAYMLGNMTDREYMNYRSAIWQAYSDRGYLARIEWLEAMRDHYQEKLDKIDQWMEERHNATRQEVRARWNAKVKRRAAKRREYRRHRSRQKKKEYLERKERCRYGR